jgi:prevent-host-death family protein
MEYTAAEARKNWSEILRRAEAGEVFTITRNGRPVVRIVPHEDPS